MGSNRRAPSDRVSSWSRVGSHAETRVAAGLLSALLSPVVSLFLLLSMTLNTYSCGAAPEQLACGSYSQALITGMAATAAILMFVGGLALVVLWRRLGSRWWHVFWSVVGTYTLIFLLALGIVVFS